MWAPNVDLKLVANITKIQAVISKKELTTYPLDMSLCNNSSQILWLNHTRHVSLCIQIFLMFRRYTKVMIFYTYAYVINKTTTIYLSFMIILNLCNSMLDYQCYNAHHQHFHSICIT